MTEGVDFAFGRPGGAALVAAGKSFVMRYVPYPGDQGKGLTVAEIVDYHGNGLDIGVFWESTGGRVFDGYPAGQEDAYQCRVSLSSIGFPADLPVYFACDVDTVPDQLAYVDDYLRGAASVRTVGLVGIYGEFDVIEHCHAMGTASWFCQTYAWSGGKVSAWSHMHQYSNAEEINGAEVDYCRSFGDNQGLWKAGEDMGMTPAEKAQLEDLKLAVFAGSELDGTPDGKTRETRLAYADFKIGEAKQSVNDTAASAIAVALSASGVITPGMTVAQVQAIVDAELAKARIIIAGGI